MIYIYDDYAGTHSTALAAAYHLKKLPTDRKLTKQEILNIDYFNKLTKDDFGKLFFHGIDDEGNSVYSIGRKRSKLVIPALKELSQLLQENYQNKERIIFSNTSPTVPIAMTMGGLFSRGLHIDIIGVPLLVIGAKQCCNNIIRLVEYTKQIGKSTNKKVIILENKDFKKL
ncbi:Protein of unknown function (DUF3189) [Schinkia azotoformans MEV2011]|uniref:Uncharacterized protein n=1 Tax=Schinkia azotoformans MEV2011 TaxID=1348973 RepID=A0A072NHS8_SCHAZ|nr:DUF3189 family protein [Schinkia azotoformans]KEF36807.1 Protein of unknown function (DUF3189) [Schinkia azotoformans MEV2011]MEC1698175.1 DUF3189 family protein [Schinkia azotoformans]MEC1725232.1 DUF3189 family protein [Schinkia azotoformans]MEC1772751.1 DUF3189 family protein [Schinkia azotoformans]MEC1777952.1 DUF3189 family protein [Schinkia azotoformans]